MYCRWALAWLEIPVETIRKVASFLKPGGKWIAQEYLNWGTFKVYPENEHIHTVIEAARRGWREMEGDINIGRLLPELFQAEGMEIKEIYPMSKLGRSKSETWYWPGTFYEIYTYRLIELGLLTEQQRSDYLTAWEETENNPAGYVVCPSMVTVIGERK